MTTYTRYHHPAYPMRMRRDSRTLVVVIAISFLVLTLFVVGYLIRTASIGYHQGSNPTSDTMADSSATVTTQSHAFHKPLFINRPVIR